MNEHTKPLCVEVSPEKHQLIDDMANQADQSKDWVVNQAIDQYIELQEWQKQHIQQRLDKANSPDAVFHSSDEVEPDQLMDIASQLRAKNAHIQTTDSVDLIREDRDQ